MFAGIARGLSGVFLAQNGLTVGLSEVASAAGLAAKLAKAKARL
jgi:hypothetical protein